MVEENKVNQTAEQADNGSENENAQVASQNKKGFIEVEGEITELLPAGSFKVVLDNGHEILAHLSGKMRMYKIRIVAGDRVRLEMSPYDMTKGRIVRRL